MPSTKIGRFQVGGAALASAAEADVLVIAHTAGDHWPAHHVGKRPGVIRVRIMPPFRTNGRDSKSIIAEAEAIMSEGQASLRPE